MSYTDLPVMPSDPLAGTGLDRFPRQGGNQTPAGAFMDVSLETPDRQFSYLVGMIEDADAANPAPFTGTPPWGESIDPSEVMPIAVEMQSYLPVPDFTETDDVFGDPHVRTADPFPMDFPGTDWYNDPQYHGLGVPPGVQNYDQPMESGHTQIVKQNPAAEQGWDAWSGRPQLARVARHQSDNPFYSRDVNRGHEVIPEKLEMPYVLLTQQYRDLLLAELKRRGVHEVVIADVPSVPFTEQVAVIDPAALYTEPAIGSAGILPWGGDHGDHLAAGGGV